MAFPSNLLIFLVALTSVTIASAHQRPPPSNETLLLKKCSDALGPGSASLVTFCAKDFLGDKAAVLAGSGKQETAEIVVKEAHKRAEAVAEFGKKIDEDKSLRQEELRELKMCWGSMSKVVRSVEKMYKHVAESNLSLAAVMEGMDEEVAEAKWKCKVSPLEKHSSLWEELDAKVVVSLKADIVALSFINPTTY